MLLDPQTYNLNSLLPMFGCSEAEGAVAGDASDVLSSCVSPVKSIWQPWSPFPNHYGVDRPLTYTVSDHELISGFDRLTCRRSRDHRALRRRLYDSATGIHHGKSIRKLHSATRPLEREIPATYGSEATTTQATGSTFCQRSLRGQRGLVISSVKFYEVDARCHSARLTIFIHLQEGLHLPFLKLVRISMACM